MSNPLFDMTTPEGVRNFLKMRALVQVKIGHGLTETEAVREAAEQIKRFMIDHELLTMNFTEDVYKACTVLMAEDWFKQAAANATRESQGIYE